MSEKEKAEELVNYFLRKLSGSCIDDSYILSKKCAKIAVEEIIESEPNYPTKHKYKDYAILYWQEVKKEIELL